MRLKDLTGTRFGRLLVLSRAENVLVAGRPSGRTAWNCKCDCGKEAVVLSGCLSSLGTQSCGCYRLEVTAQKGRNRKITDPEKIEASRLRALEKQYTRHIRDKYGLSLEDYNQKVIEQDGKCAVCKRPEKLHVDHCHKTEKVRSLLCSNCNRALGFLQDDPEIAQKAATYLNDWSKKIEFL